jgi:hypothetical protein
MMNFKRVLAYKNVHKAKLRFFPWPSEAFSVSTLYLTTVLGSSNAGPIGGVGFLRRMSGQASERTLALPSIISMSNTLRNVC